MFSAATQVFDCRFTENTHVHDGAKEIKSALVCFLLLAIYARKCKSCHIFRYNRQPMPARVADIKNKGVLLQLGSPESYS